MTMSKDLSPSLPGPASRTSRLPLLLDVCLNVTQILILVVAVLTAVLSILARADILTVILRTAVAIIAIGLPGFLLNFLLGKYYVQAPLDDMKAAQIEAVKAKEPQYNRIGELETTA